MSESKEQQEKENQLDLTPSEPSFATKGCLLGVIFGLILLLAVIITAVIIIVMSLFSDDNPFDDLDFGFIDDINSFMNELSESSDGEDGTDLFDFSDGDGSDSMEQEAAGIRVNVVDYYLVEDGDIEQFVVDFTIENINRDYFSVSPSAFNVETETGNIYSNPDATQAMNNENSEKDEFNVLIEQGEVSNLYVVLEIPEYREFGTDRTFVYNYFAEDVEMRFNLEE